jgi:hypothetical protein
LGITVISKEKDKFLINGKLVYSDIEGSKPEAHGLLMNARFIQGVFDDKTGRERYARFGFESFDPEKNTDDLVNALPEWYSYGLRAITVGFQGGGPCFTIDNVTIDNNPFGEDGLQIEPAYLNRMERIIDAADKLGMVVIVSCFYGAQALRIKDDNGIIQAVKNVSNWLRDSGFTNVIIEVANEHQVSHFKVHPILFTPEGVVTLMDIARRESGGMMVGCSGVGGYFNELIVKNSDVIIIHSNGQSRQYYYNLINKCKITKPNTPIVVNEDSQALSNLAVAFNSQTSWGYYNNMTKQEPPAYWGVLEGEDKYFAYRMAMGIGITVPEIPFNEQYYLQGLEPHMTYDGQQWVRLASLYPETIDFVEFYRNGEHVYTCYDDPFTVNFICNWKQGGINNISGAAHWKAAIHLVGGEVLYYEKTV